VLHEHWSPHRRGSRLPNLINWDLLILGTDRVELCPQNHLPNR
jgi:hypothetical protein